MFEIIVSIVLALLVIWVIVISWWCKFKASKVVTQHRRAVMFVHQNQQGPPDDWPPGELDFP